MARRAPLFLLMTGLAFGAGLAAPAHADPALRVPTCAMFLDFGERWTGIDEAVAAHVLGVPLYQLTDADIDLISKSLQACAATADTPEAQKMLKEDVKHMSSLRSARNRVRHAFDDYTAAKKREQAKLEQMAARLDSLAPTPRNRSAVDDSEATLSAIFFELEQRRQRAQVKEPLTDDYPPYGAALAALDRKHVAYAEQARQELIGEAQEALERRRGEFDRLAFPPQALDATIILQDIVPGKNVRWLTLRQWAALVLDNAENTAVKVGQRDGDGALTVEVVRPGYGTAEFAFHQDSRDLLLAQSGVDGHLDDIDTLPKRRDANDLLLAVVRQR